MLFREREVAQGAAAMRLGLLLGEGVVGVIAAHLRLPVAGEGFDQTICVFGVHCSAVRRLVFRKDRLRRLGVSVLRVTELQRDNRNTGGQTAGFRGQKRG
jgi:hypothetical protein